MKKFFLFVVYFLFFLNCFFSNDIKLYTVLSQNFIKDEKNIVRYSPLNMFDDDESTVFAVTFDNNVKKDKPVLTINFSDDEEISGLDRQGYLDLIASFYGQGFSDEIAKSSLVIILKNKKQNRLQKSIYFPDLFTITSAIDFSL